MAFSSLLIDLKIGLRTLLTQTDFDFSFHCFGFFCCFTKIFDSQTSKERSGTEESVRMPNSSSESSM